LISWINGEVVISWLNNQKFYILINCNGIGYEIQTTKDVKTHSSDKNIILWIHHIKRDEQDSLYGFIEKEERDFFRDLLNIRGIGPQIGISLLSKYKLHEIIISLKEQDKSVISSVPGVGQKMTERIFLELKNKFRDDPKCLISSNKKYLEDNKNLKNIFEDIETGLKSLSYQKKEIKITLDELLKDIQNHNLLNKETKNKFTFENLLKKAIEILEKNNKYLA